jgi:ligand-binding sensor domain-containing protein
LSNHPAWEIDYFLFTFKLTIIPVMAAKFLSFFFMGLLVSIFFQASGQQPVRLSFHEKFGPDNGLSSYNVSKIKQDHYGFIWVATQDGLNRFDGREFIVYSKTMDLKHRLLGNVINDIVEDTVRKILWVSSSYGGLNGIDLLTGQVMRSLPITSEWIKCLNVCQGMIWMGGYGGLRIYDPEKNLFCSIDSVPQTKDNAYSQRNVNFIFVDRYGHAWVNFPDYGLLVFSGATKKLIHNYSCEALGFHEGDGNLEFTGRVARLGDSAMLIGTDKGFRQVAYGPSGMTGPSSLSLPLNRYFGNSFICSCYVDATGHLWFSTPERLYKADLRTEQYQLVVDISRKEETDWLRFIQSVIVDPQNNVWVGGEKGIAFSRNVQPAFIPFNQFEGGSLKIGHVYYLFPEKDSLIWVCAQDGFYLVNYIRSSIRKLRTGSEYNYCMRKKDGHLIVSGDGRIFAEKKPGQLVPISQVYPELAPIDHETINCALTWGDSLLIMSSVTNKGIYRWNMVRHTLQRMPFAQGSSTESIINNLYADHKGRIWIMFDNALGIYEPRTGQCKKFQVKDPDLNIPLSIFFDMCELGNDYWLAVYGKGIVRMDSLGHVLKIYSNTEGISNTGVYKLFPYGDSLLFASSNNGLFSLDIKNDKMRAFRKEDGLNSNNFEEGCGYSQGEVFYAGGVDGFSVIIPGNITTNKLAPSLYINRVSVEVGKQSLDSFNLELKKFIIPNTAIQTRIHFSAINYSNPGRSIFAYNIQELQSSWVVQEGQNYVNLTGMNPGTYHLRVRAANEDGLWSPWEEILLVFSPHWYQTWWFTALVLLLCASAVFGIFRYRLAEFKKQQRIRKDIASDLHDDIGSTLNAVKAFTHLAKKEPNDPGHLNQIEESLTEASLGLRDMIWVLDGSSDTPRELMERIKKFAAPISRANGINLECRVGEGAEDKSISKTEKRNLLLIAKESINNSIKYADCRNIEIELGVSGNKAVMLIRDDGKGFVSGNGFAEGHGLKNIRQRAVQIHRQARIISVPGKGTTIEIIR